MRAEGQITRAALNPKFRVNADPFHCDTSTTTVDAWRNPATDVRVGVDAWWAQMPVFGQFIVREPSARMVWNYLLRIGPVAVFRKIRSRIGESRRNRKVAALGVGRILDAPPGSAVGIGDTVVFFAPNHSADWPRLSLDARLVWRIDGIAVEPARESTDVLCSLKDLAGWSPYAGTPLDEDRVRASLVRLAGEHSIARSCRSPMCRVEVRERIERNTGESHKPSAVLFGLGNYAKTQILPHVSRHFALRAIHELDPDQLLTAAHLGTTLDTSPEPRQDEDYAAWFIAGYHHSHADLAARALAKGAYAIVEKPLATTREQFSHLQSVMTGAAARRLFTCFHKRYSRLTEWALADLAVSPGDAVDMHCLVYEIPLSPLHWYNWPNSGSRLVSNGCHWLDYFLFMNDFAPVASCLVRPMRGSDVLVSVTLQNSAQLALSITDSGSPRLGVRDVIDCRRGDVTARMVDSTYYEAETSARVVRRRVNPMHAYKRMYDTICRRIVAGEQGDAVASLASTGVMLDLEDELCAAGAARNTGSGRQGGLVPSQS